MNFITETSRPILNEIFSSITFIKKRRISYFEYEIVISKKLKVTKLIIIHQQNS